MCMGDPTWQPGRVSNPSIPLVWAKLAPPMLPTHAVARPGVLQSLTSASAPSLTAIVAPAGYGKTTAAVQLVELLDAPVAWYALEPADDEPVRFWTYVAAALANAGVPRVDEVHELLARGITGVSAALAKLRSVIEVHGEPLVLVLDDLHVIEAEGIVDRLVDLLRHPPANLRLVATSRSDLPLPVGRLRSQGRLTEVRSDDLAFDRDELAAVLDSTFGLGMLDSVHTARLHARTEGWPVGVYLAGLGLQNEEDVDAFVERFAGDTRHLSEYLSAEAVDELTDDERAFLLATSIASILVPDLCDDLTGQPGSLGMLRSLMRNNVFTVALNAEATLFRYHPLFQEHLRSSLAELHPDAVADLHLRASRWYGRNDDIDQAITHAIAGGAGTRAEELIAGSWPLFAQAGQLGRLERWIEALGDRALQSAPICLMMNWVLLNARRYDEIPLWEARARAAATTAADQDLCAIEIPMTRSHVLRHRGDVGGALSSALEAVDQIDESNEPTPGSTPDRAVALIGTTLVTVGVARYWAGELERARESLTLGVAHARSTGELSSVVMGYAYLALVEAESSNDDLAVAHADQVLGLVDAETERFHLPAAAHLARSIALGGLGRAADADEALAEAVRIDDLSDEPLVAASISLQRARLCHLVADQAGARAAVREARRITEALPDARFDARLRRVENDTRFASEAAGHLPGGDLSERERAVLSLLKHELSRRELAAQLHVSENTVKTHLTSIRNKLGVPGRASIVARAEELGLLPPE